MADVTKIPFVANFSYRLQKNITAATTLDSLEEADFFTAVAGTTAIPLTLMPIMNNSHLIKLTGGNGSGCSLTISGGLNHDTGNSDTINGAATYSLTSGNSILLQSNINHDWTVFTV